MNKGLLLLSFLTLSILAEASCQHHISVSGDASTIILTSYDSLEHIQRPVNYNSISDTIYNKYTIRVNNQKSFDSLSQRLIAALESGHKTIILDIKSGMYYYKEGHIKLVGKHYPDTDIIIKGKNVTLVPIGWSLKNGDNIPCNVSGECCFLDLEKNMSVSLWGDMMYADSLVEVVDLATKHCRIKCKALEYLNVPEDNMAYIDLTRWARCYQYKVLKIENGNVDFYAHDLAKDNVFNKPEYNVNYDYIFAKSYPRFRLCNVSGAEPISIKEGKLILSQERDSIYLGNAANFLSILNCEFKQIVVNGICFLGNKVSSSPLIHFINLSARNVEFSDCIFLGQQGKILTANGTNNLFFHNNIVTNNYKDGIVSYMTSANTVITNNTFENNGLDLSYNRCITCSGSNYYVAQNKFKNFGYCAISLGVWYGEEMPVISSGIVEYNEMWYDKDYFDEAWKHTIMDSGAIYLWTQNNGAIVRYNYIHDYTGMAQNRGIFCDDGAHHFAIYGNVILNIPNCHAIDSRRVASTEKERNKISHSEHNNIQNYIAYNITNGTIHFVGNEMVNNGCIEGRNAILRKKKNDNVISHGFIPELKNFEVMDKNIELVYQETDDTGFVLSNELINQLNFLPCLTTIKQILSK